MDPVTLLGDWRGGAWGWWTWSSILLMTSGSVIAAITRNWPPHFGHSSMSSLKTRLSLSAQESGARGESVFVDGGDGLAATLHFRFTHRLGEGTTRLRYLALGARTPW